MRKVETHRSDGKEERECRRATKHVLREGRKEAARAGTTPFLLDRCVSTVDSGDERRGVGQIAYRMML